MLDNAIQLGFKTAENALQWRVFTFTYKNSKIMARKSEEINY